MYVDDFAGGSHDPSTAHQLFSTLENTLNQGGFPVHKFVTNDTVLESMINDKSEKLEVSNGYDKVRVLGIPWCTKTDTISIEFQGIVKCTIDVPTKRHVLSTIAQLFDPLGLVTPVILAAKIILQEAWKQNVNWDEPLARDIGMLWKSWCDSLQRTQDYALPRYYGLCDVLFLKKVTNN